MRAAAPEAQGATLRGILFLHPPISPICRTPLFPYLNCYSSFKARRLNFDFEQIALLGLRFNLPKGGAAKIGASTGLGAESNVVNAQKRELPAFFNWISADEQIATARGGGGGLALWRRL